jgi:hypothetical protein
MANVGRDLKALAKFLLDVIDGRLKTKEAIEERAYSFFGVQGPWYTVGYKMAVVIEKQERRQVLIDCMSSPRKLLTAHNRGAARLNGNAKGGLPLWSRELLTRIGAAPAK